MRRISATDEARAIAECSRSIRSGGIIAFPTETFYGLGAFYTNFAALEKLIALKRRPKDKALPLIVGQRNVLPLIASPVSFIEEILIEKFWPGPLTLLLAAKKDLSELITAGSGKIAVRIPGRSFALDLARSLEFPITATSANISGMPPAESPEEVISYFGDEIDIVVDSGKTPGGKPSTIVGVTGTVVEILRKGAIPDEEIFAATRSYQRR